MPRACVRPCPGDDNRPSRLSPTAIKVKTASIAVTSFLVWALATGTPSFAQSQSDHGPTGQTGSVSRTNGHYPTPAWDFVQRLLKRAGNYGIDTAEKVALGLACAQDAATCIWAIKEVEGPKFDEARQNGTLRDFVLNHALDALDAARDVTANGTISLAPGVVDFAKGALGVLEDAVDTWVDQQEKAAALGQQAQADAEARIAKQNATISNSTSSTDSAQTDTSSPPTALSSTSPSEPNPIALDRAIQFLNWYDQGDRAFDSANGDTGAAEAARQQFYDENPQLVRFQSIASYMSPATEVDAATQQGSLVPSTSTSVAAAGQTSSGGSTPLMPGAGASDQTGASSAGNASTGGSAPSVASATVESQQLAVTSNQTADNGQPQGRPDVPSQPTNTAQPQQPTSDGTSGAGSRTSQTVTFQGDYHSFDAGQTWLQNAGTPFENIGPDINNVVINGGYHSLDAGQTWLLNVGTPFDGLSNPALASPTAPQAAQTVTFQGNYHSFDAGQTWLQNAGTPFENIGPGINNVVINGGYHSLDAGQTWLLNVGTPFDGLSNSALASPTAPQVALTVTFQGDYHSSDEGQTWVQNAGTPFENIGPGINNVIINGGYHSFDGGQTWLLNAGTPFDGLSTPSLVNPNGYPQGSQDIADATSPIPDSAPLQRSSIDPNGSSLNIAQVQESASNDWMKWQQAFQGVAQIANIVDPPKSPISAALLKALQAWVQQLQQLQAQMFQAMAAAANSPACQWICQTYNKDGSCAQYGYRSAGECNRLQAISRAAVAKFFGSSPPTLTAPAATTSPKGQSSAQPSGSSAATTNKTAPASGSNVASSPASSSAGTQSSAARPNVAPTVAKSAGSRAAKTAPSGGTGGPQQVRANNDLNNDLDTLIRQAVQIKSRVLDSLPGFNSTLTQAVASSSGSPVSRTNGPSEQPVRSMASESNTGLAAASPSSTSLRTQSSASRSPATLTNGGAETTPPPGTPPGGIRFSAPQQYKTNPAVDGDVDKMIKAAGDDKPTPTKK